MNLKSIIGLELAAIKKRLAELPAALGPLSTTPTSYRNSEERSERRDLEARQRDLRSRRIRAGNRSVAAADAERDRIVEIETRLRVQNYHRAAERFEKQGDHRNARLYRQAALSAPEEVARQHGVIQ